MANVEREILLRTVIKDEALATLRELITQFRKAGKETGRYDVAIKVLNKGLDQTDKKAFSLGKTIKKFGKDMGEFGQKMQHAGRKIGFTGFILSFTLSRVVKSITKFAGSIKQLILSGSGATEVLGWLERTMSSMALAGDLTADATEKIMETFWEAFEAGTQLDSAISDLTLSLVPFRTILVETATDALEKITAKFNDIVENNPEVVQAFTDAAEALSDRLVTAILSFIENLPAWLEDIDKLATNIGNFATGLIDGAAGVIDFAKDISDFLGAEGEDFWVWAGKMTVQFIVLGKLMQVIGSLLALTGIGVSAGGGLLGGGAAGGAAAAAAGGAAGGIFAGAPATTGLLAGGSVGALAGGALGGLGAGALVLGPIAALLLSNEESRRQDYINIIANQQAAMGGTGGPQDVIVYGGSVVIEQLTLETLEQLDAVREAIDQQYVDGAQRMGVRATR